MIAWKLILGAILFLGSGLIASWFCGAVDWSFTYNGTDYAELIVDKIISIFGGSFLLWGFLKNPSVRKVKY